MKASDIMTQPVITIRHDASLQEAVRLMLSRGISGVPVVDHVGKPLGMLSEGDLLRRAETGTERTRPRWIAFLAGSGTLADEYVHSHSRHVRDLMSTPLISVPQDAPLESVVSMMEEHRIKHVPVMDSGRLAGMITRANLMQALMHFSSGFSGPGPTDADLRQRVLEELKGTPWGDKGYINVIVKYGVVHLQGIVTDARERDALRVAVENIPGVHAVMNRVEWCDMTSGTVIPFPDERLEVPPP
ncbi:CBS domain-containing protein [Noviherbaspirillum denitrificans]|uniref:CBS domain-containing protein n=1 Tax=Noviherbaspirillum denitrificans TaxID=1968433 RepID=UPI000B5372E7|nr:CBS domain-containing protein [Noviherbaspirillum denitrificans]